MWRIELEQEDDGRWIAEIPKLAGVMVYGGSQAEALTRVQALALRVLADRLEHEPSSAIAKALTSVQFRVDRRAA